MAAWSLVASGISVGGAVRRSWRGRRRCRLRDSQSEAVEAAFAGAAVFNEAGLLELGEVGGDGALAHAENLLQLGDGERLGAE